MRSPPTTREYSDAGAKTCEGYPGSLGYEAVDAATWQSWGIDCELLDFRHPCHPFFRVLHYSEQI